MNSDLPHRELLIRLFTEASDANHATELDTRLLNALSLFNAKPKAVPEAYWKIEGWFEHFYALSPADLSSFEAVMKLAQNGWYVTAGDTPDDEFDAVWAPTPPSQFLLPEVRWAQVLLIYPNPPAPDQEYLPL